MLLVVIALKPTDIAFMIYVVTVLLKLVCVRTAILNIFRVDSKGNLEKVYGKTEKIMIFFGGTWYDNTNFIKRHKKQD